MNNNERKIAFDQNHDHAGICRHKYPRKCYKFYFNLIPDSAARLLYINYIEKFMLKFTWLKSKSLMIISGFFGTKCPESTEHVFLFCKVVRPFLISLYYLQRNYYIYVANTIGYHSLWLHYNILWKNLILDSYMFSNSWSIHLTDLIIFGWLISLLLLTF